MSAAANGAPGAVLSTVNVSKTFAGRTVLRSLDLDVLPGEVHGFVGQNGSGKSTFIKILAGFHEADPGSRIWFRGREVPLPITPEQPRSLGISFVHQDLGLAEPMSVLDNLRVGRYEPGFAGRINWSRERRLVREALDSFGLDVDPDALVSSLSDVEAAMVAIIRALEELREVETGLLVLDEPTAYLPRDGVNRLFDGVRRAAASGVGILFVSHRLEEVHALTDRVTVLRDGEQVVTAPTGTLTEESLIEHILGRRLNDLYPSGETTTGAVRFEARGIQGKKVDDLSISVGAGEIVGLTGLLGMGFEDVPYLLFGALPATAGEVTVDDVTAGVMELTPRRAIEIGIALLPANRQRLGGVAAATITENATLATVGGHFAGGRLRLRREERAVAQMLDDYEVTPPEPKRLFGTLSGGNQQKVLVAKWFWTQPTVLLLHEPTQGVDVGARRQIFDRIHGAAQEGKAVVVASSEYEDLANLCDRVYVFRHGRVVAELTGEALTEHQIVEVAFRADRSSSLAGPAS
jgi:ribose transport system ATP-binding protein